MASGESKHTDAVVALGCVPEFLRLLDSPDEQVRVAYGGLCHAARAQWNAMAVKLARCAHGGADSPVRVCHALRVRVRRCWAWRLQVCGQAAWGLGNIAGDSVQHRNLVLTSGALTKLCKVRTRGRCLHPRAAGR